MWYTFSALPFFCPFRASPPTSVEIINFVSDADRRDRDRQHQIDRDFEQEDAMA
jgi:hypothetical protein